MELITVNELAEALGVAKSWIYERTRPGSDLSIPHFRVGKYIRFDLAEVLEWYRENGDSKGVSEVQGSNS